MIFRVSANDAGLYQCTAVNTAGQDQALVRVNVNSLSINQINLSINQIPAVPVIQPDQTIYSVVEGGEVTLSCRAIGQPKPEITWYIGDRRVNYSIN